MRNRILFIISLIGLLVFLNFFMTPYLHQRETTRIVTAVLEGWKSGDIPETFQYWESPYAAPPAYGLLSYQINKKAFYKKDRIKHGQIFATLEFSADNTFPSGKQWVFTLRQTSLGWKIESFSLAEQQ